jgi:polar amino acid transport system substrate-binding protein
MAETTRRAGARHGVGALLVLMASVGLYGLAAGEARAATLEEIKKRGYMIAATEDDYRPFEFLVDGKPQGYDHELLALLRKEAPFEIRQEILPWQGILAGVASGRYDVAISAAIINDERVKSLDFTMPIAEATAYYVKRKGDDSIKSFKDLSGKTVGVQQGSALYALLPEVEAKLKETGGRLGRVVQYGGYQEAYQDLANRRTDYVINSIVNLSTLAKERPDTFELGERVSGRAYHAWPVKKGNKDLLAFLNGFLAKVKANGEMKRLQEKWFGRSHDDLPNEPRLPGDRPVG